MRCFLGIALPEPIRDAVAAQAEKLREAGLRGSWVKPANYHVTARFLGDIMPEQLEALDGFLPAALRPCTPLKLQIAGLGAFPTPRRPRVLWAGVAAVAGDLECVLDATEEGAQAIGLTPEHRAPHPHVTLLRFRKSPRPDVVPRLLDEHIDKATDAFSAQSVALWRSTLGPGGATYEQLREYSLL